MLKVDEVRFGNFGRFVDEQIFSLDNLPKINQIDGANENTGGSSASGKTTLLRVLDYGIGINKVSATVLQSRLTKEPLFVEIRGSWNGSPVTIYRSKGELAVSGTNPKTGEQFSVSGNSNLAEEMIDQIIELPRELFKKITHKEQGEGGFFLNMTPKEAYEFMLKAMGLNEWLVKIDKAEEDAAKIRPEIVKLEASVAAIQSSLGVANTRLKAAQEVILPDEPDVSYLETIAARKPVLKEEMDNLEKDRKIKIDELDAKKPQSPEFVQESEEMIALKTVIATDQKSIKDFEALKAGKITKIQEAMKALHTSLGLKNREKQEKTTKITRLEQEVLTLQNLIGERASVEKDLQAHVDSKCPTCLQDWKNKGMNKHAEGLKAKLRAIDEAEKRVPAAQQSIETLQSEIEQIINEIVDLDTKSLTASGVLSKIAAEDSLTGIRATLEINQVSLSELERQINEQNNILNQKHSDKMLTFFSIKNKITDQFNEKRREYAFEIGTLADEERTLKEIAHQYKMTVESMTKNLQRATEDLERWFSSFSEATDKLVKAKAELALYEDARRLVKGYTMSLFEDVLDQIGAKASETISKIPNMATATIAFEPFKEVKGKIKDEIVATISMDGEEGVPIKSLCGGERNVADVAVDLAVIDMIEERTGIGSNYYILDEPTTALDDVCKIEFMEALKNCASNKRIFIVEHSAAIKEMAEHTITVVRTGLKAKLA